MDIRRRERVQDFLRMLALCAFYTAFWYLLHVLVFPIRPNDVAANLAGALISGVIQGLVMGVFLVLLNRKRYRDSFVVGRQRASDQERAAAVAALRSGRLPVEPRQHEAAISFAWYQLRRQNSVWRAGLAFGLLTVLCVSLAVYHPWLWLLVGLYVTAAPTAIVHALRQRQRARQLLMTVREIEAQQWLAAFGRT